MSFTSIFSLVFVAFGLIGGCSFYSSQDVSVIDLNKVLDILEQMLKESVPGEANTEAKQEAKKENKRGEAIQEAEVTKTDEDVVNGPAVVEDKVKTDAFLKRFADKLNSANLIKEPIGVQFMNTGAIEGFVD